MIIWNEFTLLFCVSAIVAHSLNVIDSMKEISPNNSILTVCAICSAFISNKVNAEREFLNNIKQVKGFIAYVGPDIYGLPSIELSDLVNGISQVICVLPFSKYPKLLKLFVGQEIVIEGEIVGTYSEDIIIMKNCQIVK